MFVTYSFESDNLAQRSKTHFKPLVYTLLFCVCLEFIWFGKEIPLSFKRLQSLIWLLNMAHGFMDGIHNEIWINISIWATAHLPLP